MIKSFWKMFVAINALFPFLIVILFRILDLPVNVQRFLAYCIIAAIFAANLFLYRHYEGKRNIVAVMLGLNFFAMIFAGAVSFFTAIPTLPFYAKSWLWFFKEFFRMWLQ